MAVYILFKSCPYCKTGDISLEEYEGEKLWSCVQCGWSKDLAEGDKKLVRIEPSTPRWETKIPKDYKRVRTPTSGRDNYQKL